MFRNAIKHVSLGTETSHQQRQSSTTERNEIVDASFNLAVISVCPAAIPFSSPGSFMVATFSLLLCHFTPAGILAAIPTELKYLRENRKL